jgi:hypothetical protein
MVPIFRSGVNESIGEGTTAIPPRLIAAKRNIIVLAHRLRQRAITFLISKTFGILFSRKCFFRL